MPNMKRSPAVANTETVKTHIKIHPYASLSQDLELILCCNQKAIGDACALNTQQKFRKYVLMRSETNTYECLGLGTGRI